MIYYLWTILLVFVLAGNSHCYEIGQETARLEGRLEVQCRNSKRRGITQSRHQYNQTNPENSVKKYSLQGSRSNSNLICARFITSRRVLEAALHRANNTIREQRDRINTLQNQLYFSTANFTNVIQALNEQIKDLQIKMEANSRNIESQDGLFFRSSNSNRHDVYVPGKGSLPCSNQLAGPGWTIIQRRINGTVDFYRKWNDYMQGFGDFNGEFFIGLERLHRLTSSKEHELCIRLEDFANETRYAHYNQFIVGNFEEFYELKSLGNFTGNAGNALKYNLNQKFSTYDSDNDFDEDNCAEDSHGAWWYRACGANNLNGLYLPDNLVNEDKGIYWANEDWHEWDYSYKSVIMMIRPK